MIVVDTTFLILMIDPGSTQDGNRLKDRVHHLIDTLSRSGEVIMIAAPSIAELVAGRAERIEDIVETLRTQKSFSVQAFDEVIAIEAGERIAQAQSRLPVDQRPPGWKVAMKYDAMIAATAVVRGASAIYTSDRGFGKYLQDSSVAVVLIDDLPLPPEHPQREMPV